jgi:hypothetical protein
MDADVVKRLIDGCHFSLKMVVHSLSSHESEKLPSQSIFQGRQLIMKNYVCCIFEIEAR